MTRDLAGVQRCHMVTRVVGRSAPLPDGAPTDEPEASITGRHGDGGDGGRARSGREIREVKDGGDRDGEARVVDGEAADDRAEADLTIPDAAGAREILVVNLDGGHWSTLRRVRRRWAGSNPPEKRDRPEGRPSLLREERPHRVGGARAIDCTTRAASTAAAATGLVSGPPSGT